MAFTRTIAPLYGGPTFGRFQTAGGFSGGAPNVPAMPSQTGNRGPAVDPAALAAVIGELKKMGQKPAPAGQTPGRVFVPPDSQLERLYPKVPRVRDVPLPGQTPGAAQAPAPDLPGGRALPDSQLGGAGQGIDPVTLLMLYQRSLGANQGGAPGTTDGGMGPQALLQNPAVLSGLLAYLG